MHSKEGSFSHLFSIKWVWLTYKFMCIVQLENPAYGPGIEEWILRLSLSQSGVLD